MKKQFLTKFALATLTLTMFGYNANAQLGNLKNKVKNAANNATGGTKDEKKEEKKNDTSTNNNSSNNNTSTNSNSGSKADGNLNWYKVDKNTTVFSADYGFGSPKKDFTSGENIYVRFAFPKSVSEVFMGKFADYQKSTCKYSLAISKNIDTDPIIISEGSFSIYNYEKINMMDFTITADPKTFDNLSSFKGDVSSKLGNMSVATMSSNSLSVQWEALSTTWGSDKKDWEIFLIFSPWDQTDERKPELVGEGKFSYTYNASASNSKYAEFMKPIKPVVDEGITSDIHKKYMKQIVFSKSPIAKIASEAGLTNSFNLGDDIYFRAFLEKSFVNESNAIGYSAGAPQTGATAYEVFIDGKPLVDMPGTQNYKDGFADSEHDYPTTFTKSFSRNWGLTSDKGKSYSKILLDFYYNTTLLSPGVHKVKVNSTYYVPMNGATPDQQYQKAFGKEKLLATGEFTLNVTDAGKVTVGKKLCSMPDITTEIKYFAYGAPKIVPQAADWIKKELTEKGTKATLVKIIEDVDWAYIKNGFGIITHRTLWGNAFLYDTETKLYYSRRIKYTQQNISSGGAKYGNTTWEWSDYDNVGIRFAKECVGK